MISVAQVFSTLRVTTSSTGWPACTFTVAGSKPFFVTRIAMRCSPAFASPAVAQPTAPPARSERIANAKRIVFMCPS